MGVIAENPYAYNDDKSKFDIGRIFVREKVKLKVSVPVGVGSFGAYSTGYIQAVPTDFEGYEYIPFLITQAAKVNAEGQDAAGFNVANGPVAIYAASNNGTEMGVDVNIDAYIYYIRADVIRMLS